MTKRPCPDGAHTAILVEGGDEHRLCTALWPGGVVPWFVIVGRTSLAGTLGGLKKDAAWGQIHNVGVVLDAEEDVGASVALGQSCFALLGRPVPPVAGAVVGGSGRNDGFFLLPDNASVGAMESLVRRAAPPGMAACVDALFTCTPNPGTTVARRDKAWVNAWLSAFRGEGRVDQAWNDSPPGIDPTHQAFAELRRFLGELG